MLLLSSVSLLLGSAVKANLGCSTAETTGNLHISMCRLLFHYPKAACTFYGDSIMRLWHQTLIPQLPRAQLLGQHRECAALRGNGWGRPHATVNYVFTHSPYLLYAYHVLIMDEMQRRGYRPDPAWHDKNHRGNTCPPYADLAEEPIGSPIYAEHDDDYLAECLANLSSKGIEVQG